jgi:uncharacterized protein YbcI
MPDLLTDDPKGTPSAAISTRAGEILSEYTGRGPTKARTTISRDSVAIVHQDTDEHTLEAAWEQDGVLRMRQRFQDPMRVDLIALVEENVHRKVIAYMGGNHLDPDVGVEFFVLKPQINESP